MNLSSRSTQILVTLGLGLIVSVAGVVSVQAFEPELWSAYPLVQVIQPKWMRPLGLPLLFIMLSLLGSTRNRRVWLRVIWVAGALVSVLSPPYFYYMLSGGITQQGLFHTVGIMCINVGFAVNVL